MPKTRDAIESEIREILLKEWDPIGVQDFPDLYRKKAADEYDIYIAPLFDMLFAQKIRQEVADFLYDIEVRSMGMHRDRTSADVAAESLAKIQL